jgi:hypothetical protein
LLERPARPSPSEIPPCSADARLPHGLRRQIKYDGERAIEIDVDIGGWTFDLGENFA